MLSKPRGYYILTGLEFTTHSFYKQHFYKQHQARFGKKLSQSQANPLTFWPEENKMCKKTFTSVLMRLYD